MGLSNTIEPLLEDVFVIVRRDAPHLENLLSIFAQEARVCRTWLNNNLFDLSPGSAILEVGAGLMLLSCQLVKEGYRVTALEPIGDGFSTFSELQEIVLTYAKTKGYSPNILQIPIEQLNSESKYDFAFSFNVMEHIKNVEQALQLIGKALLPNASYRFSCANYLFPYEPHFNIPTLFSKSLTEKFFHKKIYNNTRVVDPVGLWKSLNWISAPKVISATRDIPNISVSFDKTILENTFLRVVNDKQFSARRSPWFNFSARIIIALGLHRVGRYLTPKIQPLMDCTITRTY